MHLDIIPKISTLVVIISDIRNMLHAHHSTRNPGFLLNLSVGRGNIHNTHYMFSVYTIEYINWFVDDHFSEN